MENNQTTSKVLPVAKKESVTGAGRGADTLLGVLISIVAADIISFLWLAGTYATDLGYADWSRFWRDYESGLFYGVSGGGLFPVALFALFGLFAKTRWKYLFRGMLVVPFGVLIFSLLFFGACMLMMGQW